MLMMRSCREATHFQQCIHLSPFLVLNSKNDQGGDMKK